MSSLLANRRKARKVGTDEDDDAQNGSEQEQVIRRPNTKPKQKSKLRLSFGPGGTSMADAEETTEGEVITPKRLGARKPIKEQNGLQRTWAPLGSSESIPLRVGQEEDRPTYNKEYLRELRNSTPSTPKQTVSMPSSEDEREKQLDISAKFGEIVQVSKPSVIPTDAEIREKKERRARLAMEQGQGHEEDFISLDDAGDDDWSLSRKAGKVETRLVRDDEDFAEGFDEYVEDGIIAVGRKAEREQQRRERAEMKELIDEAQESSEADDSEAERKAAYEASQTRAGMDGLRRTHESLPARPKTPPKITPLPRLADNLARLRTSLNAMENSKAQLVLRMEELRIEKAEISARESEIQTLLKEAGENYERLRAEAGLNPGDKMFASGTDVHGDRGLENLGGRSELPSEDGVSG
ncbi:hypothetical protein I7I51_06561 [Histoplasma capsulatum]|uniref:Nineteen complex-related protein 2 domain-containing protein n=1 Tax=Ajellomyces capsulatus TaxID=5037 RepID=A0A8A1MM52_AJECA|nr:conserved hypothetical protein [Histoplasma mississippiense (nom. inval.)]EDN06176.1 conserved hypothetical protein [Histoplasma mississippiense (nom. inval.)]QSS65713.1 hypothetical protein I7I51_06561 [Histoplasma capsulatum]